MLNKIKSILKPADRLIRLARNVDSSGFEMEFMSRRLLVLQAPAKELDPSQIDEETILREIESAAQALSEAETVTPYSYADSGVKVLPIFSSSENAEAYIAGLASERNKILPFGFIEMVGCDLLRYLSGCDRIILNPRSRDEVDITDLLPAPDDA